MNEPNRKNAGQPVFGRDRFGYSLIMRPQCVQMFYFITVMTESCWSAFLHSYFKVGSLLKLLSSLSLIFKSIAFCPTQKSSYIAIAISPTFTLLKIRAEHGFRYLNKLDVILNTYLLDFPIHSIQNTLTDEGIQNFDFRNEISYLERTERRTAILNVCIFRYRPSKHEYMLAHSSE